MTREDYPQFKVVFLVKVVCYKQYNKGPYRRLYIKTSEDQASSIEEFHKELSHDQRIILMESFLARNKSNLGEIVKLLTFVIENCLLECVADEEFISQTNDILSVLKTQEIDVSSIKRQQPDILEKVMIRLNTAIENSTSMDFAAFLKTITSLLNCDAVLFDKRIFKILIDCMMRQKTDEELTSFETLLSLSVKIYGKDMNQFLKKLLKSIDEKLNSGGMIAKKRKRKLMSLSEADVTNKKQKVSGGESSDRGSSWPFISHHWTNSVAAQFSEAFAGLNVNQFIKVYTQLKNFLVEALQKMKESSSIEDNTLFKIELISCLLSELFISTRIHEHLMEKENEIASLSKEFDNTLNLFYEIVVNVEYNNKIMNALLKMTSSYESFVMLFFYNYNAGAKTDLESFFKGNQSGVKKNWKIIQQRIRNFGKTEEKSHLNYLMIKEKQKDELLNHTEERDFEDFSSILNDHKQTSLLLQIPDTRASFINLMGTKELEQFAQYLTKIDETEKRSAALDFIAQSPAVLDNFVTGLLGNVNEKELKPLLEILSQLPLACLSDDNKKLVFDVILQEKYSAELHTLIKLVALKLFRNDSFKLFFKVFTMSQVMEKLVEIEDFAEVYYAILSNAARKLNRETLDNFEWIIQKDNAKLIMILAQVAKNVQMTPSNGVSVDEIKKLKTDLFKKLLKKFSLNEIKNFSDKVCEDFLIVTRLFGEYASTLQKEIKDEFVNILRRVVQNVVKMPSAEKVKLLVATINDAKKISLDDELKGVIVDCLVAYQKSLLAHKISSEVEDSLYTDEEKQLFEALKPFKSKFQECCADASKKLSLQKSSVSCTKLRYFFKIYQIIFNNTDETSSDVIKSYLKFLGVFASVACGNAETVTQVLETNNSVLKKSNFQLNNAAIDEFFCLLIDPLIQQSSFTIEEFCKFYAAVGESLFLVANYRHNYFKSRISQYFNVYKSFMYAVYFYKNNEPEELTPMEISLLLTLTLQLENIMKMIAKNHTPSTKIISTYVASSIVSIFVRNPKTLSVGYKFRVNIKNICYQLLSTFDDKARKHVYSVADETTRDVYDGLFNELRRKA